MDRKWRKNELPKSKKYCTWLRNFNENFTKIEFQIACFAVY
ncbi:hypothetical protein T11_17795 [Trichinella zimbabwensis]|uniref:Uncharacterized protein n=1 Tax=Trichinella zimbabwensis TaxID=268475 RepID=A0A0V1G9C3_9BILA|nr:hypothetical protein T11_8651 [Trichinella zimbabwensis]KRY94856.1 hypothetical protein T11_17795 [Trichinella zimbabwensis]